MTFVKQKNNFIWIIKKEFNNKEKNSEKGKPSHVHSPP